MTFPDFWPGLLSEGKNIALAAQNYYSPKIIVSIVVRFMYMYQYQDKYCAV